MKYPIVNYCGFNIERKKVNTENGERYYFVIDLIGMYFKTLENARNYIDFLAR